MLSVLWNLFKSMRYILPFLNEVTDTRDDNIARDDLYRIEQLKKLLSLAIWRIIYIIILAMIVFWYIIPLYTKNAVLEQEVYERDKKIIQLTEDAAKARNEVRRVTESLIINTNELKAVMEDRNRLANVINECRASEAQYRNYLLDKTGKLPSPIKKADTEAKTSKPKLSESLKLKLDALK